MSNLWKSVMDFLIKEFNPSIECVEAGGKCDYRISKDVNKCPCELIIGYRNVKEADDIILGKH